MWPSSRAGSYFQFLVASSTCRSKKGDIDCVSVARSITPAALITTSTARGALGRARMLAVTSGARSSAYPDIPTIAERGFAGYDMDDWFGLFAASGTPEAPIKRMQAAIAKVTREPALAATMAPLGMVPVGNSSQEFVAWLASQREILQKLVRDANITLG